MSDPKGKVFAVQYQDKAAVLNCYMPFLKEGGIFIPSSHSGHLGESVFVVAELPDAKETYSLSGKVAWLSRGRKMRGFGVRLLPDDNARRFKTAVENLLGGSLRSVSPTHTM